jgi:hypothetical protein
MLGGSHRGGRSLRRFSLLTGLQELIGDWWIPLIIRDLSLGLERSDDLAANLGLSRNLLTTRLRGLVEANIVERVVMTGHGCILTVSCSTYGQPLTTDTLDVAPGPDSAPGPGTHLVGRLFGCKATDPQAPSS